MRLLLLSLFALFHHVAAYNYLVVSPVFGYSHMKFMSKVADTLANGGHNVVGKQWMKERSLGVSDLASNICL